MEKWPNELLLARHGQSEANVRKEAAKAAGLEPSWTHDQRDMDTPLTNPVGQTQAFVLGMELARRYPPTETYRYHSVVLANEVTPTEGKSFNNFLLAVCE